MSDSSSNKDNLAFCSINHIKLIKRKLCDAKKNMNMTLEPQKNLLHMPFTKCLMITVNIHLPFQRYKKYLIPL